MLSVVQCVIFGLSVHTVVASGNGQNAKGVQSAGWSSYGSMTPSSHGDYVVSTDYTSRYHGPGATPVVLPDGTLANTPEVAAARSAHLAALQKAQALWYGGSSGAKHGSYEDRSSAYLGSHADTYSGVKSGSHSGSYDGSSTSLTGKGGSYEGVWPSYSGPLASVTVLPSGYLADSSDVAAAKVAHLGAVAQAYAEAAKWPADSEHSKGWKQW